MEEHVLTRNWTNHTRTSHVLTQWDGYWNQMEFSGC